MVDYREILRLNSLKYTQRQIAASVHSSRNTISEVIKLAAENNLCWPLNDQLTNEKVYALLYPNKLEAVNPRKGTRYFAFTINPIMNKTYPYIFDLYNLP